MSLRIELTEVAKRYRREWVLRNVNLSFGTARSYALTGPNGSGKSTLLRILSGHLSPTRGAIRHFCGDRPIHPGDVYRHLAFAAPYIELIEEFTLEEAVNFHRRFQPLAAGLDTDGLLRRLDFRRARAKDVRHFSSGMKQRLKLALAIASDTPLLLLDEPTTNLDRQGVTWYLDLINDFVLNTDRLVIVASNVEEDYGFCSEKVSMLDFKS